MPLFLGHTTAEAILDLPVADCLERAEGLSFDHCFASRQSLRDLDLSALVDVPLPISVLVSSANEIRSWQGVSCRRISGQIPIGAFCELAPDVHVASPELLFVLKAQELTLAQTIAFGSKLCSGYAIDHTTTSKIRRREPLTTPERLEQFVSNCSKVPGIQRARLALKWILPGAASPMETLSAMPFYLSRRLNGFGFPFPHLNYEITLNEKARRLANKSFIKADIYWPDADFGLEYQGREYHSEDSDIAADIARQLAAESQQKTLQMITIEQIRDLNQRMAIAEKVAWHLGREIPNDRDFLEANQRLVDDILSALPASKWNESS